jgi:uncharacterized protein YjbI with pentapeptide repeats
MEPKMIGSKIAEARKKTTISQAQLAAQLFVSPQAVGKWERGESLPDIITLNRLAEILGVDLNYFSESFQSVATEMAPVEPLDKQATELTSKGKQKPGWDMSRGNWVDADFSGLKNLHDKFSSSNMQRCKFSGSDLSGLLLKNNNVDGCNFTGSDINSSRIQGSNLAHNLFNNCSLKEAKFSGSHIDQCDFSGANLAESEFSKSHLYGCALNSVDFTGVVIQMGGITGIASKSGGLEKNTITNAVWNRTSFIDSQIADIVFTGIFDDCYFEDCAFKRVIFQNATLRNTFFKNKSLKGIRFIDCKADRMTYEFLKNGKADLTGITQLTSSSENE